MNFWRNVTRHLRFAADLDFGNSQIHMSGPFKGGWSLPAMKTDAASRVTITEGEIV